MVTHPVCSPKYVFEKHRRLPTARPTTTARTVSGLDDVAPLSEAMLFVLAAQALQGGEHGCGAAIKGQVEFRQCDVQRGKVLSRVMESLCVVVL